MATIQLEDVDLLAPRVDDVNLVGDVVDGEGPRSPEQRTAVHDGVDAVRGAGARAQPAGVDSPGRHVAPVDAVRHQVVVDATHETRAHHHAT